MFTRSERNRLEELSLSVLGNAKGYVKLLKDPAFKVLTGYKETQETFFYKDVPVKIDPKTGKTKFIRERVSYPKDQPLGKVTRPVYRDLTFLEIEGALIGASEMKGFTELLSRDEDLFYEEVVRKYKDGSLINKPNLYVPESDKAEFEGLFSTLPADQQTVLRPYVVAQQNNGVFSISGLNLVTELVYQNTHTDETVTR